MKDSLRLRDIIDQCNALRDKQVYSPYQEELMREVVHNLTCLRTRALNSERRQDVLRRAAQEQPMHRPLEQRL